MDDTQIELGLLSNGRLNGTRRAISRWWKNRCFVTALLVWLLGAILCSTSPATVTVGLYFVEGQDEPIDFLTIPGFPAFNFVQPWQITATANQFVVDGALAGITEQQVRSAIFAEVKNKFYSIPTPTGYVLDMDFRSQKVSGPGSVNVLLGKHNVASQQWFGFAKDGGGMGAINGENNAAVSINRIDSLLNVNFTAFDHAINAISNVLAHETAHLFGLEHVWADDRADLGWQPSDPVVMNPYDVMATGPTALPDAGWIQNNIFTTVPGTQSGGHSSVSLLIENLGLRKIGDADLDGDVDNSDLGTAVGSFTGSGTSAAVWAQGDMNFDGDVDNADLGAIAGNFTGALAGNLTDSGTIADLIYDPATGNVKLDATEAQLSGTIGSFQLENFNSTFFSANYIPVTGGTFNGGFKNVTSSVIGDTDFTFAGFSGIKDIGNVFPAGMTLVGLQAYLKTAVYTGSLGSGQQQFDLVLVPIPEPGTATLLILAAGGVARFRRQSRRR